ncbi:MAG TPA: putative toxin [Polyangiaceae bacterium LLY-WYZ-15_(1-7)]|nr:putative toxin [Polyangiaceae bacterium LLY-WYZ-15_(1-7)]
MAVPFGADAVDPVPGDPEGYQWAWFRSTGADFVFAGFAADPSMSLSNDHPAFPARPSPVFTVDVDGNGWPEVFHENDVYDYQYRPGGHYHRALVEVRQESHVGAPHRSEHYDYAPLSDPVVHTPAEGCAWPLHCAREGGLVVSKSRVTFDGSTDAPWEERFYRYAGALADLERGRPLGFQRREVIAPAAGQHVTVTYDPTRPDPSGRAPYPFAGVPVETTQRTYARWDDANQQLAPDSLIAEVVRQDEPALFESDQTHFVYTRTSTSTTTEGSVVVRRSGVSIERMTAEGVAEVIERTNGDEYVVRDETDYVLFDSRDHWSVRPRQVERTRCKLMRCSGTRRVTEWELEGAAARPLWSRVDGVVTEDSSFPRSDRSRVVHVDEMDPFGHATMLRTTAEGEEDRVLKYAYEGYDALAPTRVFNALGHETQRRVHPWNGRPWRVRDPNGAETEYGYDGFARLSTLSRSDVDFERRLLRRELPGGGWESTIESGHYASVRARTRLDGLGRVLEESKPVPGGGVSTAYQYDPFTGQLVEAGLALPGRSSRKWVHHPDEAISASERWTRGLGRVHREENELGGVTTFEFAGPVVKATNPRGGVTTWVRDIAGRVVESQSPETADNESARTQYEYDEHGALARVVDDFGFAYETERDAFGRPTRFVHPDTGAERRVYDAFGQVVRVLHEESRIEQAATYDLLGRVTEITARSLDGVAPMERDRWYYDPPEALGELDYSLSDDYVRVIYGYGPQGVPRSRTTRVDGRSLSVEVRARGVDGRVERARLATDGVEAETFYYDYDTEGFLERVRRRSGESSGGVLKPGPLYENVWERLDTDPDGSVTLERMGALTRQTEYDVATGLPEEVTSWTPEVYAGRDSYGFDPDGRLAWRATEDGTGGRSRRHEALAYDARGQLTEVRVELNGRPYDTRSYHYDNLGNLVSGPDHTYTRDPAHPHRYARVDGVESGPLRYDERGNLVETPTSTVQYSLLGQPRATTGLATHDEASFEYDADGALVRTRRPDAREERLSANGVDFMTRRSESVAFFRPGTAGALTGAVVAMGAGSPETWAQNTGWPGSSDLTVDGAGRAVSDVHYDERGRTRQPNWSTPTPEPSLPLLGFAGHAMTGSRFIHMGARLYDRELGLMTSPDPISDISAPLDRHPFAYAHNDPFNVVDPTGAEEEGPSYGATATVYRPRTPFSGVVNITGTANIARALGWTPPELDQLCSSGCRLTNQFAQGTSRRAGQIIPGAEQPESTSSATGTTATTNYEPPEWDLQLVNSLDELGVDDFFAGLGDFVSMGLTREFRVLSDTNHGVDEDSGAYTAGQVTGFVAGAAEILVSLARGGVKLATNAVGRGAERLGARNVRGAGSMCFAAGTLVALVAVLPAPAEASLAESAGAASVESVAIEEVRVGDRVAIADESAGAPWLESKVGPSWQLHELVSLDGRTEITLLREPSWLDQQDPDGDGRFSMRLAELGFDGEVRVVRSGAAPTILDGPGRVVLGTVHQHRARVHELVFDSGERVVATGTHPFWSADREGWVDAAELRLGEAVQARGATAELVERTTARELAPVYNLEIEYAHEYQVGATGLRVHNVKGCGGAGPVATGQAGEDAVRAVVDIGPKEKIFVNDRYRIPDGMDPSWLNEVKNVKRLSNTRQLRDFLDFAQQTGRKFRLFVRQNTRLSGPLEELVQAGVIILEYIP